MLDELKTEVFRANLDLVRHGLVIHTWGNVSGRDLESGFIVIKPSGVDYQSMHEEDMVVLDPAGLIVEGKYKPSTDAPTHLYLYNAFPSLGGVVHTHSTYATAWAQAGKEIPPFGTTHADHFHGAVPCTRLLSREEVEADYELNTGKVIVESLSGLDPLTLPSVIVNGHGPFSWGSDVKEAVYNAVALEEISKIALFTVLLGQHTPLKEYLLDKHFRRKHGKSAYYGQGKDKNK